MNRRTLIGAFAAGAALPLLNQVASSQPSPKTKNVVFVHGLFADGSSWSKIIPRLQEKGINCTSVQNPLTSLQEASDAARRAIALQPGPTVLVGHSFSGMIVTEVGVDPKLTALVYVAARAPDAGEEYTALAKKFPTPPASAGVVFNDDWGQLTEEAFLRDFAGDLPKEEARVLYAVQAAVQEVAEHGQDDQCRLAHQAHLLRRVHRRPDDQSRPRALHGQADGCEDDRG
jgi:pimeloyl-ACP methyl ester carboxylesterase